jgi:cytochrome b561
MTMVGRLRAWAESYTREGRYSPLGVLFHWVMAALVIFQLGLGWVMTLLMPAGGDRMHAYELHSGIGLAIFLLAFMRMVWRVMVTGPYNEADTMGWRTTFAYLVEHIFYVCFFLLPITGWAMWSSVAPPGPLSVGGIIPWPQLPLEELPLHLRWQVMGVAESAHYFLVWVLMILVPVHVAAAVKHHFWDRSDVLRGMLPEVPDWEDPRVESKRKLTGARLPEESEVG